ncbi:hypothetical protein LENED_011697 [Lentinula edodes]|uniref:Uncharacterized protein n=1 Tax=Lentinula edodes TaxID=5353 RepID=A0A1Q3EQQ4_LENED|nr:hypothetical protein LENED_011697 [Lentinula edodes]
MLDEQDAADADQQELQEFLALQQGEAVVAAKRKRDRSPMPMAGPSVKRVRQDASKKRSRRRSPEEEVVQEAPLRVRLVVPPSRSVAASTSTPPPPRASPSLMEVSGGDLPVQGHSNLVRLAAVAEAQSGLVQQPVVPPSIKGAGPDLLSSNMPPASRPTLVPRALAAHPYRAVLAMEVLEHETEYRRVLDQFVALDGALPGTPGQSILECFRKMEEDLRDAVREHKVAVEKLSSSTRKSSQLTTTLLYQQGRVDESNALATCQRRLVEELQEEVHRACDRAAFVEQMLEGDLNKAREDLRRVATLAHRLHCSDPATVLHHHHRYIGAIIEAVVAFLRRGLESEDPDIATHNLHLALDYMQAARGVHGDLYVRSISSIQWFFNNAVDEDEGLYRLVLEHSRFDNDGSFLTAAHTQVPMSSVEPGTESLAEGTVEQLPEAPPLFLPEQESPTSPSPPPPSPTLPPPFGSVVNLAIDLTGDDDELYETEESRVARVSMTGEVGEVVDLAPDQGIVKEESL